MPIYDYLCTACDHRADILHGLNDPGPNYCPSCGAEGTMRKQFSAPSIHFKGSGWAKKDRGGATSTKAAAKSSAGTPDASAAGGGDAPASAPPTSSTTPSSTSDTKD